MTDLKIKQYQFKPISEVHIDSESQLISGSEFSRDEILAKIFKHDGIFHQDSLNKDLIGKLSNEQQEEVEPLIAKDFNEQPGIVENPYQIAEQEITKKLMEKYEAEKEALHQQFKSEYDATLSTIKTAVDQLLITNEEVFLKYKKYFFDLVMLISEKLALTTVDSKYEESIYKFLSDTLDQIKEMKSVDLTVHPQSLEKAEEIIKDLNISMPINFKIDDGILNKSDCRIEWSYGSIESILNNRKDEIIKLIGE